MSGHDTARLDLFVTEACNLGCSYCFAATRPRRNPTFEDARKGIDWLLRSRSPRVHLTLWGGEPMLRRALLARTVAYARDAAAAARKTVTFSMPTNATLLDEESLAWLEAQGVRVFLSIDGDEEGQRTRPLKGSGGSSHGLVQLGMKRSFRVLGADRAPIRMTVTPENAAQQGPSVRYFLEQGARVLMIYPAFDQPWTDAEVARFRAGQAEVAALFVERLRGADDPGTVPVFKAWKAILRRLLDGVPPRPREGPLRHCGAGSELVALTVEGQLAPCHRFVFYGRERRGEDVSVGDLDTGVDPARSLDFRSQRIEGQVGKVRCVECDLFDLCTYGCLAVSYASTGALHRIPPAACALMESQVSVCREIHDALAGDPRYALYLGRTPQQAFDAVRRDLAARARTALSRARGEDGQHEQHSA